MKSWIKFAIVLIVCIIAVGGVYIWRFGIPEFLKREDKYMEKLYAAIIAEDDGIQVNLESKTIVFTKKVEEKEPEVITFALEDGVLTAVIPNNISQEFTDLAIKKVFVSAVKLNEQSEENAIYSLIPDVLAEKKLEDDGFSLTNQKEATEFSMKINKKFNLANGEDVYIKVEDIEKVADVIKYKLQSRIIEKPGIVLEKTISYSKNLVYIIYEKDGLTDRTYNSMMALISTLVKTKEEYVKENYPSITKAGTIMLDGITISLNEKINEDNVHLYSMPEGYGYMIIRIDANKVER